MEGRRAWRIPEVTVGGPPGARGHALGRALREPLRAFLADNLARINTVARSPVHRESLAPVIHAHAEVIRSALPALAQEIDGLAEGAGIPVADAYLLQMRREVLAWAHRMEAGDCSTIALAPGDREPVLAQTVDLQGGLTELAVVLRVLPERADTPEALLYTFIGLLGYLGINDAGIAVGINMVVSDDWAPGVPPYLLVRHLLSLRTLEECLEALRRIPRSSSRCLTLMDTTRTVQVEMTRGTLRVLEGPALLHTNHYIHPELEPHDRVHPLIRRSSRLRLRRLSELVEQGRARELGPDEAFSLLSDHAQAPNALCCHGDGDARRFETVAAVALLPRRKQLHVRPGPPCRTATQSFSLGERRPQ